MALEAIVERDELFRVVLEAGKAGIYVFVFLRADSKSPERDYLQDTWEQAKEFCQDRYAIPPHCWREIPNPGLV